MGELLGYVPIKRKKGKVQDTRTLWYDYSNKTAEQRSQLTRKPCWAKAGGHAQPGDGRIDMQKDCKLTEAHANRRKELKQKFRNMRTDITMDDKRALVRGPVDREQRPKQQQMEYERAVAQGQRIKGAIRDCSHARGELLGLQKSMRMLGADAI